MIDLTTSAHFRLKKIAGKRLRESDATQQSDNVRQMFDRAMQTQAQEIVAELLCLLQGNDDPEDKVQGVIVYVQDLIRDDDDDESVDNSPTKVTTTPRTASENRDYLVGNPIKRRR